MSIVIDDIRAQAAQKFEQLGWPTPRLEEWKYTNFSPVAKVEWKSDDAPQPVDSPATLSGRATLELQFVNGTLVATTGDKHLLGGDDTTIADWERNALIALNAMHSKDGARIEIAAGSVVDGFIHLLFVGQGDGIWSHPRNVVKVGANAQVAIVETYVGSGKYFTNAVTEIVAGEGAVVDHYRVVCESNDAFHYGHVAMQQQRGSSITSRSILIGGSIVRSEVSVALAGEGSSVTLDGLFAGTASQHLDNRTVVDHIKPHCESTQLYKGVLDQNARGVFDGRIIVRPDAQKTNSRQTNRNLLLSETAVVDSRPNLEIHNDDVKCSHGSTIGQIDEESLFYLRSRGIDEDEARNLLVYAFASEIVDRMTIEPVAEQIRRALFRSMPERLPERRGTNR